MVDAKLNILSSVFLFSYEACCEASATGIHDRSTLLPLYRWVKTQIFPACEAKGSEFLNLAPLLCAVFH